MLGLVHRQMNTSCNPVAHLRRDGTSTAKRVPRRNAKYLAIVILALGFARSALAVDYILRLEPPLAGAAVYVDGNYAGLTDDNGKIIFNNAAPGAHQVRVQADGLDLAAEYVFDADLNDLEPFRTDTPDAGNIRRRTARYKVDVGISGATVYVDGSPAGVTHSRDGTATIDLLPGRVYRIAVAREGFAAEEQRITATAGGGTIRLPMRDLAGVREGGDPVLLVLGTALGASVIVLIAVLVLQHRRRTKRAATTGAASAEPGAALFDRYRLVSTLGSGGVGMIYRAIDVVEKATIALKILDARWLSDPDMVRKFLSEGEVLKSVAERDAHNSVVRCFRHGREHGSILGRPFIALELLEGETLQARLKREPVLQERIASGIALQIASALTAVHAAGIVHRDLTPDNIFLKNGDVNMAGHTLNGVPRVVLIDFGIARLDIASKVTMDGSISGKPQYMSPEQCRGFAVDGRSDLYSLGIIMFLMTAGRTPFDGRDPFEVMRAQMTDVAPVLTTATPHYLSLTHRLLAKDIHARPQSAALVASELLSFLVPSGQVSVSTNLVPFPERRLLP